MSTLFCTMARSKKFSFCDLDKNFFCALLFPRQVTSAGTGKRTKRSLRLVAYILAGLAPAKAPTTPTAGIMRMTICMLKSPTQQRKQQQDGGLVHGASLLTVLTRIQLSCRKGSWGTPAQQKKFSTGCATNPGSAWKWDSMRKCSSTHTLARSGK